jgi:hypothetical protein
MPDPEKDLDVLYEANTKGDLEADVINASALSARLEVGRWYNFEQCRLLVESIPAPSEKPPRVDVPISNADIRCSPISISVDHDKAAVKVASSVLSLVSLLYPSYTDIWIQFE